MLDAAEHALQLEGFRRDQVLELQAAAPAADRSARDLDLPRAGGGADARPPGAAPWRRSPARWRRRSPRWWRTSRIGKKKYAAHEPEMREVKEEAEALRRPPARSGAPRRRSLRCRAPRPADAGDHPRDRRRRATGRSARPSSRRRASRSAPPRPASRWWSWPTRAARLGNTQRRERRRRGGPAGGGGRQGALLNVQINLKSAPGNADKDDIQTGLQRLREALGPAAQTLRRGGASRHERLIVPLETG